MDASAMVTSTEVDASLSSSGEEDLKKTEFKSHSCYEHFDTKQTCESYLRRHQQSKHEGVLYSCDQCDFIGTHKLSLRTHQQSKHEGVIYS